MTAPHRRAPRSLYMLERQRRRAVTLQVVVATTGGIALLVLVAVLGPLV